MGGVWAPRDSFESRSGTDRHAIIPTSRLPMSNDDFGDTHGTVLATTPDGQMIMLTDPAGETVEVFYDKDALNHHDSTVPNWFYYWQDNAIIQGLLNAVPGLHLFDTVSCRFDPAPTPPPAFRLVFLPTPAYNPNGINTYGSNLFSTDKMKKIEPFYGINDPRNCDPLGAESRQVVTGYDDATRIEIGQGCGYSKAQDLCAPMNGQYHGIHTFYATVAHEIEHAIIECEVWNYTHPSDTSVKAGYNSLWDDDGDGYKDLWERQSFDGVNNHFSITNPPSNEDKYDPNYESCFCSRTCSAGTMYEEKRCRDVEAALRHEDIDDHDWSHDPSDDVQGKQWNNR